MVEQRGQMVAWLRKMVRRGSTDEDEEVQYVQADSVSPSISPSSSRINQPQATLNVPNNNLPKQRLNIQDSASVMTIASSSKRRRQSIDTNASTRAMAAESVFSWSEDQPAQPAQPMQPTQQPQSKA